MSSAVQCEAILYYVPARGRAEVLRVAMAEAGVAWRDETPDMKNETERKDFFAKCRGLGGNATTNIPLLYFEGKYLTQTPAALLYIARKYGMYPADDFSAAYNVDRLLCHAADLRTANYKPMALMGGTPEDLKAYKGSDNRKLSLHLHLSNFENLLGTRDYFADDGKFCVADLSIYDALDVSNRQIPHVLEKYPRLKDFHLRIEGRPGIAEWLASDQRAKLW
eukprot:CAMPEP_0113560112 /NCGR_PEP_ID=MMETSP0015_2-20120614/19255_1 /TAXON_ID=2838 /ORGANISM="Odontella" /LENGTH=221 /DNA_ID=CAMNT_0000461791 /DNA_START=47 /DNA_END=709 /DNA_ORIENTATION=- /assembly_acc=CAM_ASM_000160